MRIKLRSTNTSGIEGVSYDSHTKKWLAKICIKRKQMSLGVHELKIDAAKARHAAEVRNGFVSYGFDSSALAYILKHEPDYKVAA